MGTITKKQLEDLTQALFEAKKTLEGKPDALPRVAVLALLDKQEQQLLSLYLEEMS